MDTIGLVFCLFGYFAVIISSTVSDNGLVLLLLPDPWIESKKSYVIFS